MTETVRSIHKHVEDLFIFDIEALCYLSDYLQYHIPDSLCERKFHTAHGSVFKQSADSLVVREPSGSREQIILHGGDGCHCNLRGKVAHLVLSESKVLLPLLEYDFQGPTHGVNPVGFNELFNDNLSALVDIDASHCRFISASALQIIVGFIITVFCRGL